jgi:hypothetical protein
MARRLARARSIIALKPPRGGECGALLRRLVDVDAVSRNPFHLAVLYLEGVAKMPCLGTAFLLRSACKAFRNHHVVFLDLNLELKISAVLDISGLAPRYSSRGGNSGIPTHNLHDVG